MVDALDEPGIDTLVIVRVRNWFDHKWLRFSGIGRVKFEDVKLSAPGAALEPLSQDKLTFPPFTPRRIVSETHFTRDEAGESTGRIHPRRLQHSSGNLQRRVADRGSPLRVAYV